MFYGRRESALAKKAFVAVVLLFVATAAWHGYRIARGPQEEADAVLLPGPDIRVQSPTPASPPEAEPGPDPMEPEVSSLPPIEAASAVAALPPPPPPYRAFVDEPWLHVSKGRLKMYYYIGDRLEREYSIAVGANGGQKERVGDHRTPVGSFSVQQIQDSRGWTYDFGDGKGPIRGAYGPWFIRLKTPRWKGIGIHGTHDPESIGTMVTQGCVRLWNKDLEELKERVFIGMKVIITE